MFIAHTFFFQVIGYDANLTVRIDRTTIGRYICRASVKGYREIDSEAEATEIEYQADFSQDLNAIMENEATLSEEFKEKTAVIFEAAIKSKLAEEIDRLEEKYHEEDKKLKELET